MPQTELTRDREALSPASGPADLAAEAQISDCEVFKFCQAQDGKMGEYLLPCLNVCHNEPR